MCNIVVLLCYSVKEFALFLIYNNTLNSLGLRTDPWPHLHVYMCYSECENTANVKTIHAFIHLHLLFSHISSWGAFTFWLGEKIFIFYWCLSHMCGTHIQIVLVEGRIKCREKKPAKSYPQPLCMFAEKMLSVC